MKEQSLIHDGYTTTAYFKKLPGIHPEVRTTVRPLYGDRRVNFQTRLGQLVRDPVAAERFTNHMIADHIMSWSIVDHKGEPAEVNADNVHCLQPSLRQRFYNLITGVQGGDVEPVGDGDKKEAPEPVDAATEYQAAMSGQSVEEFTAGNSEKG